MADERDGRGGHSEHGGHSEVANGHASLADWLQALPPVLDRLGWFVPAGFRPDFSADSLDVVEAVLAEQVTLAPTGEWPADTGLVESASAYLGEALLRVAGGRWDWDADPSSPTHDLPLVRFDDTLGLPAAAPLRLLIDARRAGTGVELRAAHERLQRAVAEYQSSHPGWKPAQQPEPAPPPRDPWLTDWLDRRANAFPAWSEATGEAGAWDFARGSIDRLVNLALRRLTTVEEFTAEQNAEFVEGAAWYLGETVRRSATGTSWQYQPVPDGYKDARDYYAQTGDAWAGSPYLLRQPEGSMADPRSLLKVAVIRKEPDSVGKALAPFFL
jgi:hypothetical protein